VLAMAGAVPTGTATAMVKMMARVLMMIPIAGWAAAAAFSREVAAARIDGGRGADPDRNNRCAG
jgi:hypothetical protein